MLSQAQVHRAGVLLVQYRLARLGVDAAELPVRRSLAVHSRKSESVLEVALKAVQSGSRVGRTCEWHLSEELRTDLVALLDLTSERVWLLSALEVQRLSSPSDQGGRRLHTYTVPTFDAEKTGQIVFSQEFDRYLLERRAAELLGGMREAAA